MNTQRGPALLGSAFRRMEHESRGHVWWYRAPLLIPMAAAYLGHLSDRSYTTIVSGIDLIMHEGGHLLFTWLGNDLVTVLGGTLFQVGLPLAAAVMFFRQGDHFAVAVAGFWIGINLAEVAPYAADARSQLLPLVSPFAGAPRHDWNYLLATAGLLEEDQLVGKAFHHGGILVMTGSLALAVRVLRWMATSGPPGSADAPGGDGVMTVRIAGPVGPQEH